MTNIFRWTREEELEKGMPAWGDAFLHALSVTGNVRAAAKAAGITVSLAHQYRKDENFAAFTAGWENAILEARDLLLQEAWQRATTGRDSKLLMFLLRGFFPEMWGGSIRIARQQVNNTTTTQTLVVNGQEMDYEQIRATIGRRYLPAPAPEPESGDFREIDAGGVDGDLV
jgi:hypothetical protein